MPGERTKKEEDFIAMSGLPDELTGFPGIGPVTADKLAADDMTPAKLVAEYFLAEMDREAFETVLVELGIRKQDAAYLARGVDSKYREA